MDKVGEKEGEGEMCGERNIKTYDTTYKTDSQWEFAIWLQELKQVLCGRMKCGVGEGDGREKVWEGGDMGVPVADSCWCMTENHKIL